MCLERRSTYREWPSGDCVRCTGRGEQVGHSGGASGVVTILADADVPGPVALAVNEESQAVLNNGTLAQLRASLGRPNVGLK